MGKLLLITGTDTGVGKTTVTTVVTRHLISHGYNVHAIKPVETGCPKDEAGELVAEDAALHAWAMFNNRSRAGECVRYKFETPAAPMVAARMENQAIDKEALLEWVRNKSDQCDLLLVEGAGGLLVPILENYTFADFARELQMDVLVVVGSRLGAGNHSALTFELRKSKGLNLIGYVFNDLYADEAQKDPVLAMNRALLREIGEIYRILEVGYLQKVESPLDDAACDVLSQSDDVADLAENLIKHYSLTPSST